jgi:hypothetical protein
MYAWDNGLISSGRIRREMGSWGLVVVHKVGGKNGRETIEVNDCGTIPLKEELRMAESLGSVGASCGLTLNMKNFESARIDCWVTLPCKEEELDSCFQKCHDFAAAKVQEAAAKKIAERTSKGE